MIYRPVADETARSTALRRGELQIMHETPLKDRRILKQVPEVNVRAVPGTFFEYIGLNTQRPPLDDAKVRQAIAWAVNRQQLNDAVKFGQARILRSGPIPHNHWAHLDEAIYPGPDRDKARQLLAATDLPQSEIAWRCGFSSTPFFSDTFKRVTGVRPGVYRRSRAEQGP